MALILLLPTVELSKDHTLYIVALAAYPDTVIMPSWNGGASLTPVARVAVDEINNDSSILPDYRLELLERDDGCDITFKAVTSFIEPLFYSGKQVVGMVGPGCSEAALAIGELSTHDSTATLMVSVATTVELNNRTAYPYILRTVSTSYVYVKTYFDLMRQNNWKNVAVLFDYYRTYFSYTFDKFKDEFAKVVPDGNITFVGGVTESYFPLDALVQSRARVILGFLGGELTPQLLCLAYHKKIMYPTYQWVFHDRSVHEFKNGSNIKDKSCPNGECVCSGCDLQAVLNNVIFCHYKLQRDDFDNTTLISGKNFTTFFNKYSLAVLEYIAEKNISYPIDLLYGPTYYDTVWSLARALDRADRMDNVSLKDYWPARGISQLQTTKTILKRFFDADFSFEGASGLISYSYDTGDTITTVEVFQLHPNSSSNMASKELIGVFNKHNLTLTKGIFIPDKFQTDIITVHLAGVVLFAFLLTVALALTVAFHVINVIYCHSAALKATSPKLNHVIFLGCYMIIAATMIFIVLGSFKPTTPNFAVQDFLCNAFWWLLVQGFTVIFGVMIGRLWRTYRIFTHFQDPGNLLSNYHLLGFVGLLVCLNSGCLLLWMVTDRLRYEDMSNSFIDFTLIAYWDCNCRHFVAWLVVIFAILAVPIGMMVTLAVLTRHVANVNFKHTKSTNILAYLLGVLLCICVPVYAIHHTKTGLIDLTHSIMCAMLVGSVYLCNILIFLPPVVSLYREKRKHRAACAAKNEFTLPVFVPQY